MFYGERAMQEVDLVLHAGIEDIKKPARGGLCWIRKGGVIASGSL